MIRISKHVFGRTAAAAALSMMACSVNVDGDIASEQQALAGNVISGRVTAHGVCIPGFAVTLAGSKSMATTSDWNGNYAFYGLSNGSYSVRPTKTSCAFTPDVVNLNNLTTSVTQNFSASGSSCNSNASTQV